MSGEGGFLARWSRRKRAALEAPAVALPELPASPEPLPALEPEIDPATLPSLDSLTTGSDLTDFLRPGVPQALRQAALRRMWSLDPAIRDYVGPADYAWDFNAPDGVPGFALELGGDVARLLAQAIGLTEAPQPEASGAEPEAGKAMPEPGLPPAAEAAPALSAPALPAPALPEAIPPPAPPIPPARRHGGARPA